jgi:hypothetical protein
LLLPCLEFRWSDLVSREIPFVQSEKFTFGNIPEAVAFAGVDFSLRPYREVSSCGPLVHTPAHDLANNFAKSGAMAQPERIRLAKRLPDSGIAGGRTLIRLRSCAFYDIHTGAVGSYRHHCY